MPSRSIIPERLLGAGCFSDTPDIYDVVTLITALKGVSWLWRAFLEATRMSQASASSNPPVIATPLMAPMTGFSELRMMPGMTSLRAPWWYQSRAVTSGASPLSWRAPVPLHRRTNWLPLVLRDHPDLRNFSRVTLLQSLRCVNLALWDEERRRLVSFREARARRSPIKACRSP